MQRRGGFTLIEMMVAVTVTWIVSAGIYNLLLGTQRLSQEQGHRVLLQSSVRAGSLVVMNELSELGTLAGGTLDQNDVQSMNVNSITYRATRGIGFLCHAPGPTVLRLARNSFSGHRDPQPGRDEAYLYRPGNSAGPVEDSWLRVRISTVATGPSCPGGHGPGITMNLSASLTELPEPGTPVRLSEVMELRLYQADGEWWLGARSVSSGESIQPLVGPLAPGGFRLEYMDVHGNGTIDSRAVRRIRFTLRGVASIRNAGQTSRVEEELVSEVALRNSGGS